jgi:hypothetical protein
VNETQFYIPVAVGPALTTIVVLAGILINNNRLSDLRGEMTGRLIDLRGEITARFADAGNRFNDMRELYHRRARFRKRTFAGSKICSASSSPNSILA